MNYYNDLDEVPGWPAVKLKEEKKMAAFGWKNSTSGKGYTLSLSGIKVRNVEGKSVVKSYGLAPLSPEEFLALLGNIINGPTPEEVTALEEAKAAKADEDPEDAEE
jgi:hypothetical protein